MPAPRSTPAAQRLLPEGGHSAAVTRITALASRLLSTPDLLLSTQVSLLTDVQTVAGGTRLGDGALGSRGALADSLCTVTAEHKAALVVPRAARDARVKDLPPVTSGNVAAYLGVPLASGGEVVGALCAFGRSEREWQAKDVALLEELAEAVVAQLELEALTREYADDRVRWELAVEASGIGTFEWDLAADTLHWDERTQAMFGYAPGEFTSEVVEGFSRVHAEDRPELDEKVRLAVEQGVELRAEYRVVWPDGQVRWIAARGRALQHAEVFLGTVQDITEIRTAKDEAARLLETMATGFLALDPAWQVTYLNRAGARVVGYTAEELVGRNLWEAFPGLEDSEFGVRYREVVASGKAVEFEAYYDHLQAWFEVRAEADPRGLSLYFLDITDRYSDRDAAVEATDRLALLAEVSAQLADAGLETEGAIARLGQLVVPQLADWCVVTLLEDDRLADVGSWHHDPQMLPVLSDYVQTRLVGRADPGSVQRVRETGRTVIHRAGVLDAVLPTLGSDVAKQALTALRPESLVVVPLTARDSLTGALSLVRSADRPPMTDVEVSIAQEIAVRAGLALDNARLYAKQRSLAEELQRSLLTTPPEPDHCQIVVRYAPAAEVASVGGDWFDSFLQQDGATVLVIGDVMGHDTAAAASMGQVRGLLRGIGWHTGAAPAELLGGLDAAMRGLLVSTTATAVVARLEQDPDERERGVTRVRWSNAGHPPPMLIHPEGKVQPLTAVTTDLLLGIDPSTPRTDTVAVIDRGATLLLYTDGLVERRDQDLDTGLALLATTLAELAPLELDDLCDQLLERMQPDRPDDDVALIAVRLHRQDLPRPAEAGPTRVPPDLE